MDENVEARIKNSLAAMEYHIKKLPFMLKPSIQRYTFSKLELSDVTEQADGKKTAKITAHVQKEEMIYWTTEIVNGKKKRTGPFTHNSLDEYWDLGVKFQVTRPEISNTDRALFLMQFKENLEDNYGKTEPKKTDTLKKIISDTSEDLLEIRTKEGEIDFLEVDLDNNVHLNDPALEGITRLRIGNLRKGLFLDEKNAAKIRQYKEEGRFAKGEKCVIEMYRQIAYQ